MTDADIAVAIYEQGSVAAAARSVGTSRTTIYRRAAGSNLLKAAIREARHRKRIERAVLALREITNAGGHA